MCLCPKASSAIDGPPFAAAVGLESALAPKSCGTQASELALGSAATAYLCRGLAGQFVVTAGNPGSQPGAGPDSPGRGEFVAQHHSQRTSTGALPARGRLPARGPQPGGGPLTPAGPSPSGRPPGQPGGQPASTALQTPGALPGRAGDQPAPARGLDPAAVVAGAGVAVLSPAPARPGQPRSPHPLDLPNRRRRGGGRPISHL